jgi:hypothetical protein
MIQECLATGFPFEKQLRKWTIVGIPVEMFSGDKADLALRNQLR